VLAAHRLPRRSTGQLRHHLLRGAQVLLRHDPRLAVDSRGLHQVVDRCASRDGSPRSRPYVGNTSGKPEDQAPQRMPRR
jgi:hypothetical protein